MDKEIKKIDTYSIIANNIKALRIENDISIAQIASDFSVSRQYIEQIEKNKVSVNLIFLYKISYYYKVSAHWFLGKEKSPNTSNIICIEDYLLNTYITNKIRDEVIVLDADHSGSKRDKFFYKNGQQIRFYPYFQYPRFRGIIFNESDFSILTLRKISSLFDLPISHFIPDFLEYETEPVKAISGKIT